LTLRVLSGIVLIPFLLGVAYLGHPAYGLLICAATAFAAWEMRGMLRRAGYASVDVLLLGLATLLPLDAWLRPASQGEGGADTALIVVVVVLVSLSWMLLRQSPDHALVDWALSLSLALYLGGLMQFYMPLRGMPTAVPGFWVIGLLLLSWACDSSAYFVGRAVGRKRLAPSISPNKSVEGAVAGLIGACVAGVLLGLLSGRSPLVAGGYGLAMGVATIVGDLVESFVKRQMGAKDSGVLIPGHGGLLDRMDSLLFCAPVAVLYLRVFTA
jgi:phosphatidate cytidylyltransferase